MGTQELFRALILISGLICAFPCAAENAPTGSAGDASVPSVEDSEDEFRSACPADGGQRALVDCMRAESEQLDQKVLGKLKASISSAEQAEIPTIEREKLKKQMLASQKAWINFRALDCQSRMQYLDNSDSGALEYWDCMRRHAGQRLLDFELFLNN